VSREDFDKLSRAAREGGEGEKTEGRDRREHRGSALAGRWEIGGSVLPGPPLRFSPGYHIAGLRPFEAAFNAEASSYPHSLYFLGI